MLLKAIDGDFTICKTKSISGIDFSDDFCFTGKTDEELSLVCRTGKTPGNTLERQDGCRMFRIEGTLAFSLTGILSDIAEILAEENIGIFAVSTFNTDYILTKTKDFDKALEALAGCGYEIIL